MPLVLAGATSGSTTIQATDAVTATLTLPSTTGTVMVNGPAFSAYRTGNQTGIADSTYTKIQLNTEIFDTALAFDPTTNYRFTPTKSGYYQINISMFVSGTTNTRTFCRLYKNGANINVIFDVYPPTTVAQNVQQGGAALVYMNGTTDYLEIYGFATGTGLDVQGANSTQNIFSGVWIRS
jgi:hypothetical protein